MRKRATLAFPTKEVGSRIDNDAILSANLQLGASDILLHAPNESAAVQSMLDLLVTYAGFDRCELWMTDTKSSQASLKLRGVSQTTDSVGQLQTIRDVGFTMEDFETPKMENGHDLA